MTRHEEFDCLVALWTFIAEEYSQSRSFEMLEFLEDVTQRCNELRDQLLENRAPA